MWIVKETDRIHSLALLSRNNTTQPTRKDHLTLRPPTASSLNPPFSILPCESACSGHGSDCERCETMQCNATQSSRGGDQLGGEMWLKLNMQSIHRCSIEAQKARRAPSPCGKPFSSLATSFRSVRLFAFTEPMEFSGTELSICAWKLFRQQLGSNLSYP